MNEPMQKRSSILSERFPTTRTGTTKTMVSVPPMRSDSALFWTITKAIISAHVIILACAVLMYAALCGLVAGMVYAYGPQ